MMTMTTTNNLQPQVSGASLPTLAPELIIHVFVSTGDFASALALSSSSKNLRALWTANVSRVIECFQQAQELIDAEYRTIPRIEKHGTIEGYLARTKRLVIDSKIAIRAHKYWVADVNSHRREIRKLPDIAWSPCDRPDFLKAYYRASTLATLLRPNPTFKTQRCLIQYWDLLNLHQVEEVVHCWSIGPPATGRPCIAAMNPPYS